MFHSLRSLLETERGHAQLGTGTTFTNDREFFILYEDGTSRYSHTNFRLKECSTVSKPTFVQPRFHIFWSISNIQIFMLLRFAPMVRTVLRLPYCSSKRASEHLMEPGSQQQQMSEQSLVAMLLTNSLRCWDPGSMHLINQWQRKSARAMVSFYVAVWRS
jgi:hypothetical protein